MNYVERRLVRPRRPPPRNASVAELPSIDPSTHLASSTGQTIAYPADLIAAVDEFVRGALGPDMRDGDTFKDAPPHPKEPADSNLVAFSGRTLGTAHAPPRSTNQQDTQESKGHIMHITKNDVPVKIDAPGANARHLPDFGVAAGALAAEYFTMGAGADLAPLLEGLDHDSCHSAHWGFMITGDVVVTYDDDNDERCTTGDLFYWPPGHSVRVETDTELVMFSPQAEHAPVLDHILAKMAPV